MPSFVKHRTEFSHGLQSTYFISIAAYDVIKYLQHEF